MRLAPHFAWPAAFWLIASTYLLPSGANALVLLPRFAPSHADLLSVKQRSLKRHTRDVIRKNTTHIGKDPSNHPYMGWSSWSLQATHYLGYNNGKEYWTWLTEEHIKSQIDALHAHLQKYGYLYVNIDSGWHTGFDNYGRPIPDTARFPHGISGIAAYAHTRGLKVGVYTVPGIPDDLYKLNPVILGTTDHIRDIVVQPLHPATGWDDGYKIDYSKPGSQQYIDSIAALFASWGVDFLKLDGVTPGSDHDDTTDARPDVAAWRKALNKTGRPVWLELSWAIDGKFTDTWRQYANGWRLSDDVESYGSTLVSWESVARRFGSVRNPVELVTGRWSFGDIDSLDVGNGLMDGLTQDERQCAATLWAIQSAPWFTGDDLTKLDPFGIQLLTNKEVLDVDQAGSLSTIINRGNQQIRYAANEDGSITVALFNRDTGASMFNVQWKDFGLNNAKSVRDLWSHANLTQCSAGFIGSIQAHACRLLRVTPRDPKPIRYFRLRNQSEGNFLSVEGGSTNDAASLTVNKTRDDSSAFTFLPTGNGFGVLVNKKSGQVINIPGPSVTPGLQLIQYFDDGNSNSRWKLVSRSDNTVQLVSLYDGLGVAVQDTRVVQAPARDAGANWQMIAIQ